MKFFAVVILAAILVTFTCLSTSCRQAEESGESTLPMLSIGAYVISETDDSHSFEMLELGKPRRMVPVSNRDVYNHCYYFVFDGGIIELVSENQDVQLSWTDKKPPWGRQIPIKYRTYGFSAHVSNSGYISGNPLGSNGGEKVVNTEMMNFQGYDGREYYLRVNAYRASKPDAPVITAQLKLVQQGEDTNGRSNAFTIELVSYEMSEVYQMELAS